MIHTEHKYTCAGNTRQIAHPGPQQELFSQGSGGLGRGCIQTHGSLPSGAYRHRHRNGAPSWQAQVLTSTVSGHQGAARPCQALAMPWAGFRERGLSCPSRRVAAQGRGVCHVPRVPVWAGTEPQHPHAPHTTTGTAGLNLPQLPLLRRAGFSGWAVPLMGRRRKGHVAGSGLLLVRPVTPAVAELSRAVTTFPCLPRSLALLHLRRT